MSSSDAIRLEHSDAFLSLFIPVGQRSSRAVARRLPFWRWNSRRRCWDFPACQECAGLLATTFVDQGLQYPPPESLPTLAEWITEHGYGAGTFFPAGCIAVIKDASAGSKAGLCTIEKVILTRYGRLRYDVRDERGKHHHLDADALADPRYALIPPGDGQGKDILQLDIFLDLQDSWQAEPSGATHGGAISVASLREAERELIAYFARHPSDLRGIHPGVFEDLVLAVYRNHGFDVHKLGAWNQADGGVDIIAVQRVADLTELRLAIQCKRSLNAISARPIRELNGVLDRFHAHRGVLCTTSWFTPPAIWETSRYFWRISLEDHHALVDKLRRLATSAWAMNFPEHG